MYGSMDGSILKYGHATSYV